MVLDGCSSTRRKTQEGTATGTSKSASNYEIVSAKVLVRMGVNYLCIMLAIYLLQEVTSVTITTHQSNQPASNGEMNVPNSVIGLVSDGSSPLTLADTVNQVCIGD